MGRGMKSDYGHNYPDGSGYGALGYAGGAGGEGGLCNGGYGYTYGDGWFGDCGFGAYAYGEFGGQGEGSYGYAGFGGYGEGFGFGGRPTGNTL